MGIVSKPKKTLVEQTRVDEQAETVALVEEDPSTVENAKKTKKRKHREEVADEVQPESTVIELAAIEEGNPGNKKKSKRIEAEIMETPAVLDKWWAEHECSISGIKAPEPARTFRDCGFPKRLAKACEQKFDAPTVIQSAAWPLLMGGQDLVAISKTGSGKTLGFALPFLARSELGDLTVQKQPCNRPRMVALAPTRELTQQIAGVVEEFAALASKEEGKYPVTVIVGGLPKREQCQKIKDFGADIICATTGRLLDLATGDWPALDLSHVQFLVLDEADRMLDMGFIDDVRRIGELCPATRQTVFFSATWPRAVHRLAASLTRDGATATVTVGARKKIAEVTNDDGTAGNDQTAMDVETEGPPTANERIHQVVEVLQHGRAKLPRLMELLKQHRKKKILVFALYKKEAANLEQRLQQAGFPDAAALQGDMTQIARNTVMENFRSNVSRLMIATDVASRGLDVRDIDLVINYTFPLTIEDFVHRVGRTARGSNSGEAITLFNAGPAEGVQDEKQHAGDLARVLRQAKQVVPEAIEKLAGSTVGNKATKKKAHPVYGNFFRDEAEMAKLEAKKVHTTFADSDEE